jgi:hypothetical protein
VSSRDSLPRRHRSIRRRRRKTKRRATGASSPQEVGACTPLTKSRGGGKRESAGAPTARQSVREAAHAVEVPARAAEAAGGAAVATSAAATAPVEPPRKRKQGFSTLR